MKHVRLAETDLSQMMLGTVQFGLNYGIANTTGQPTYEMARDIIACAYENGVNCLDTAAVYGNSEDVIGRALVELGITDKIVVATKIKPMSLDFSSKAADSFVEESVVASLRRLRLDVLHICLFHNEENCVYTESLAKLKCKGLVRHIGASVMTPEMTSSIVTGGSVDALQAPTNIFDRRFSEPGILKSAKERGVAVFIRSVYLQGLLLMPEENIMPELAEVVPVRRRLRKLASQAGISLTELAMRYVLSLEGVTCALVGVDTVEQLQENIKVFQKGPLDASFMNAVTDAVPCISDHVLTPKKWSKRMADVQPEKR